MSRAAVVLQLKLLPRSFYTSSPVCSCALGCLHSFELAVSFLTPMLDQADVILLLSQSDFH